jgi:hypothetical protein
LEHLERNDKKTGLAVFSKEGEILGTIEYLDKNEWKTEENFRKRKQYLLLNYLNASYSNKYKGIGTALIQEAIQKSKNMGLGGQLKINACNYLNSKRGSPIPFYAKMGFIDPENPHLTKEELIAKYSDNPPKNLTMLLLSPENKEKLINLKNK